MLFRVKKLLCSFSELVKMLVRNLIYDACPSPQSVHYKLSPFHETVRFYVPYGAPVGLP